MKTVLIIFGTRPEAIKMCPLVRELKTHREFQTLVAVTGQHREMLTEVLKVFSLTPEFDLDVMKPGQTLLALNGTLLLRIGELLETLRPDLVLVHGDTATAFSAATAAFFCGIPIGHVEAGLRSGNIHAPFPEEYNRSAISLISTLDFAPTEVAKETLLAMGKPCARVFVTGNTVVDALHFTRDLRGRIPLTEDAEGKHIVFLTSHRRENLGDAQRSIFRAAVRIADAFPDVRIICPLHRNPQVRTVAREIFCARKHPHIFLTEPFDVVTCHHVLSQSTLVLTDSGGIQEEASALGVPLLVLRDTTERPEIV
ncbi:MAG: UDP-N-acetylglucosamine 2-epimerase (non-hydrolyzing), partial [Clostridia bacterium]|nr:UDP-N-acetylglucosamine 2-epimerase (non-hydrolyzing) [Clostridia bacterium]